MYSSTGCFTAFMLAVWLFRCFLNWFFFFFLTWVVQCSGQSAWHFNNWAGNPSSLAFCLLSWLSFLCNKSCEFFCMPPPLPPLQISSSLGNSEKHCSWWKRLDNWRWEFAVNIFLRFVYTFFRLHRLNNKQSYNSKNCSIHIL